MKNYIIILILLTMLNLDRPVLSMEQGDIEQSEEIETASDMLSELFYNYTHSDETDESGKIAGVIEILKDFTVGKLIVLMYDIANELAEPNKKFDQAQFNTFLTSVIKNYDNILWIHELYYKAIRPEFDDFQYAPDANEKRQNANEKCQELSQVFNVFEERINRHRYRDDLLQLISFINLASEIAPVIIFDNNLMDNICMLSIGNLECAQDLFNLFILRFIKARVEYKEGCIKNISYTSKLDIINSLVDVFGTLFGEKSHINPEFKEMILSTLEMLQKAGQKGNSNDDLWEAWKNFLLSKK